MSVLIKIAGVDRTTSVDSSTFNLIRALTNQVDTFKFDVIRKGGVAGGGYKPSLLDSLLVQDDYSIDNILQENGSKLLQESTQALLRDNNQELFGGQIVQIDSEVYDASDSERFVCSAKDYSYDMDKTLVIATYQNTTVNAVIADIKARFLDSAYNQETTTTDSLLNQDGSHLVQQTGALLLRNEFNNSGIDCPLAVNYISFNYEYPSKCLQQLADLVNYDWYVDATKKIFFFQKSAKVAPFNLSDTSNNYYYNSLVLKDNLLNLRNSVIVRGGQYLGSQTSEIQLGNNNQTTFVQGYQYNSIFVKVNGVSKTVGIANIDDPTLFDCLYNFQEKFVVFPAAVANGATVEVGGLPYIPVIVKVRNTASIALYGEHQYKIVDKSINSKQGARDRASAELVAWSSILNEGSFETKASGLDVGQQITIASTIRGISDTYIISRISTKMTNGREFVHSVTLVTTKTYGMIEFLMALLMEKDKQIEINANEVTDAVESANETITTDDSTVPPVVSISHNPQSETIAVAEVATVQALGYGVTFCTVELGVLLNQNAGRELQETSEAYPITLEQSFYYPSGVKRAFNLDGSPLG